MLPDLTNSKIVALDTETYDPRLTTHGPGFLKGWGSYMIGFSYAAQGGGYGYIPTRHSYGNCDDNWQSWLRDICGDRSRTLLFANAKYDIEVLHHSGIDIKAKIIDVQTNDALINENHKSFSLAAIAERRLLPAKGTIIIENALREKGFSVRNKPDWSRLKDLPLEVVEDYAGLDASLTLAIYYQQVEELKRDKLEQVADLESALIPIFWQMRLQGVDVDVGAAENLNFELQTEHMDMLNSLVEDSGYSVDPFTPVSLAKWVRNLGFEPPKTIPKPGKEATGNDSISNEWLEKQNHPLLTRLAEYRKGEKIRRDFVDALVIENSKDGKVHPQWFSTRGGSYYSAGEDYQGTRTGRPSCTDPNLTQIPSPEKHPRFGSLVRSLFKPAPGAQWGKFDYSAQEPRITVHFAYVLGLPGAAEIWRIYQSDPLTDYHQATADLIHRVTGLKVTRKQAKTINLGLAYGMGRHKLAKGLGLDLEAAIAIIQAYHEALRFMRDLLQFCSDRAQSKGYVRTVLGRRRHFDEWENAEKGAKWEPPVEYFEAQQKYKLIKRANTYKALNAAVQGSAAEQTKTAMLELAGHGLIPLVQVYDELGYSIFDPSQVKLIKDTMEGVKLFTVPHVVEVQLGDSWSA